MEPTGKHIVVKWGPMPMMYMNVTTFTEDEIADLLATLGKTLPEGGTIEVESCTQCGIESVGGMTGADHYGA